MARRFFFVAAGLFLLSLAYQLGAVSAHAQGSGTRIVGDDLVVAGGALYELDSGIGWTNITGLPVPADQIAVAQRGPGLDLVLTVVDANGTGWGHNDNGSWTNYGPAPGGATPALKQSWGELKARYR